jgi:hypothetical protein
VLVSYSGIRGWLGGGGLLLFLVQPFQQDGHVGMPPLPVPGVVDELVAGDGLDEGPILILLVRALAALDKGTYQIEGSNPRLLGSGGGGIVWRGGSALGDVFADDERSWRVFVHGPFRPGEWLRRLLGGWFEEGGDGIFYFDVRINIPLLFLQSELTSSCRLNLAFDRGW